MSRYSEGWDDSIFDSSEIIALTTPKSAAFTSAAPPSARANTAVQASLNSQFATMSPQSTVSEPTTLADYFDTAAIVVSSTAPRKPVSSLSSLPSYSSWGLSGGSSASSTSTTAPSTSSATTPSSTISNPFSSYSYTGSKTSASSLAPSLSAAVFPSSTLNRSLPAVPQSSLPSNFNRPQLTVRSTSRTLPSAITGKPLSQSQSQSQSQSNVIDLIDVDGYNHSFEAKNHSVNNLPLTDVIVHSHDQLEAIIHHHRHSNDRKGRKEKSERKVSGSGGKSGRKRTYKINCQVIGAGLMGVQCVPDNRQVTEIVKNVSGALYDDKLELWTCPITAHNAICARFTSLNNELTEVKVERIDDKYLRSDYHTNGQSSSASAGDGGNVSESSLTDVMKKLPPRLVRNLYPFQREGVSFAVQHNSRALIADEMGLGKSIQAISIAAYYQQKWPVLIVCPSSLRLNWRNEISRWLPNVRSRNIQVVMTGKDKIVSKGQFATLFTIISYDLVAKFEPQIRKQRYRIVIADESHYLKSHKAKRTHAFVPILKAAEHCLLLSGTPALSRPIELYTQIDAITRGKVFGSMTQFGDRYCGMTKGRYGVEYRGATNLAELHFLLKKHCMIRRLKDEVLTELRPKTRTAAMVAIDNKEVEQQCKRMIGSLTSIASSLIDASDNDTGASLTSLASINNSSNDRAALFELYRKTGEAKLSGVIQYIGDLLEGGAKFLVFAHHLSVLDGIQQYLDKNGHQYFRLDGSTKPTDRQAGVDRFQSDPHCRVALLSITAGGTGITLTASSIVVFAELAWTPALLLQAEDRVHRIGQANAVNCHYLLGNNSLDSILWPMIAKKLSVVGSALNGEADELEFGDIKGNLEHLNLKKDSGEMMEAWMKRQQEKKSTFVKNNNPDEIVIVSDDDDFEPVARKPKTRSMSDYLISLTDSDNDDTDLWISNNDVDEEIVYKSDVYAVDSERSRGPAVTGDDSYQRDGFVVDDDEEVEAVHYEPDAISDRSSNDIENDDQNDVILQHGRRHADRGKKGKKRVLVSDDDDEPLHLTPTSASSLSSVPFDRSSMYSELFGVDSRTVKREDRKNEAKQRKKQRIEEQLRQRSHSQCLVDDSDGVEDQEESNEEEWEQFATNLAKSTEDSRRAAAGDEQKQLSEDDDAQWLTKAELTELLLSLQYSQSLINELLRSFEPSKPQSNLYSVHFALDAIDEIQKKQPPTSSTNRPASPLRKVGTPSDEAEIPCDQCGAEIPFDDYAQHSEECGTQRTSASKGAVSRTRRTLSSDSESDFDPILRAHRAKNHTTRRRILIHESDEDDNCNEQQLPKRSSSSARVSNRERDSSSDVDVEWID